ncbi:ribonuclease H-like domain-containing protein [Terrisporobacter petrolearius]|uniref:ribonuclease H-like domain-containing protein n=1 Tax=Terrisporobacter petrolearius TaxID=1460447 RepID=UPI001D16B58C|nr:ribonuclease H-like domain-containing protein [Terrisporobacter petrolearius]MCC3863860.1 ribonuclease H-like domain-containing protein [Terrisporobacter petrolearius]
MKIIEKILIDEKLNMNSNTFIFDIETTGLSPKFCKVILIGILYNCQDKTVIKQFFAENEDEEKELLLAFVDNIKCFKRHVTYNGLSFDIGFVNYRLKKHHIDFNLNKEDDFDIFRFIKSFKSPLGLEDCSLNSVETYFNIHRDDVIDGGESVKLYKEFVKNKDRKLLDTILLHNYEDIYNLSKLVNIKDLVREKLDLIELGGINYNLKVFPLNYKINAKKLCINYFIFTGEHHNISIYNDNYSIICQNNNISLEININKGIDRDKNNILFYNLSKIIPLKFNDHILEDNIYSLCDFIIKKELNNI